MIRLLMGRDWKQNRDVILDLVAADVRKEKGNRILMVPELVSHETERLLCRTAGDTASRYAEVLSFTRLARRVADAMGSAAVECLDEGGRVVAMAAAARQLSSKLKAYASVETRPEFLTNLIDAVDEFKRCCISPQDLAQAAKETEGTLCQKLEELSLLMACYDSLCSQGKRDPRDQMTWLLEQLEEGDFAQSHVFYIDGFPDFTRQNQAILEHLILHSPEVTVSMNCDCADSHLLAFEKAGDTAGQLLRFAKRKGIPVQIEVLQEPDSDMKLLRERMFQGNLPAGALEGCLETLRADGPYAVCMDAAEQVLRLVSQGCRFRDITLVCTDMQVYQPLAEMIFHRFHIPLYHSGTEEILSNRVIATVLSALDAALDNFEQRSTLRYLRSALSPMDPDTCDLVENYAVIWKIRGAKWTAPWTNHPEGLSTVWTEAHTKTLEALNQAREQAIQPLAQLRQAFRQAKNVREQVQGLYAFLQQIQLEERLAEMAGQMDAQGDNRSAQILNQLWEILLSALEQLYDVLGSTCWESEYFTRLLHLLLSQYHVGTIPPVLDAVQMGPVSAMRCHQEKHLFVLGAEEGSLPGYSGSSGVLTDQERVTLRQLGVPLTGGAMEGIQAEFAEIYGVFSGAEEQVRVYCGSEQPSFVFRRLSVLSGGEKNVSAPLGFGQADKEEAAAYLARWDAGGAAALLGLERQYRQACRKRDYQLGKVEQETIRRLYGHMLTLSASQIDQQAQCRFSYFMKYGLKAKERKEAAIDPAQFGTFVHDVLEHTARTIRDRGGFSAVSLEETMELAHTYSQRYAQEHFSQIDSQRVIYLFQRNIQELDMVVQELWQELHQAAFEPVGFEVNFGKEGGLPAIAIANDSIPAVLLGFIDRVDTWSIHGTTYYRVVDYKTGKKDFNYCDVRNGVGLQMLLYLFALREGGLELLGDHPVAAGVQYFPARAPYLPADGKLDSAQAEKERKSQWKRSGLLLKDEGVLQAMEPGETPQRLGYHRTKDGTLTGDLADREQMKLLEAFVFRVLKLLVEDIASGNVAPNPYSRGTAHDCCVYCPYGSVCHKEDVAQRRNYKSIPADRFWEEVEKELNNHG